jgi:adenine-specific DNA-methyltransferase
MTTAFHASYWAHGLLLARPCDTIDGLSRSIGNARVDLNPHQIDAALFALRSPYSRGALLADEVGLGKTIEAGLILSQKWAERRRRILLVVPATLRKQWQLELEGKFFLPSLILESKSFNDFVKRGVPNPLIQDDRIVICSYQFVYSKRNLIQQVNWDLAVIDEAHRLRNIYKGTKTAEAIVASIQSARKLLLTATPLQNSLLELYGLVSILDPDLFGSQESFQLQYMNTEDPGGRDASLRERLQHVCKRTLRRQVMEYIRFTERFTHTADFIPSPAEQQLYEEVSAYLQRATLVAIPNARRKLITLILRKLLASSSAAIAATLDKFVQRLSGAGNRDKPSLDDAVAENFETLSEIEEEWDEVTEALPAPTSDDSVSSELIDLERFVRLARAIERDSKATKLIEALPVVFSLAEAKGALRKAVVFTESRKTQDYLFRLLSDNGYEHQVVLMNGSNNDEVSNHIYRDWRTRNEHRWNQVTSGSKSADMKAAIVEEFRDRRTLLLATESAAEGVNLQFCSIVINYDLPWNPQRIEQRIGRCHRYGQKCDVLVVNFLNRKNAADQRVFELLSEKFQLFEGVFGASDEVLGVVESGVDLEKTIAAIYQDCRTQEEIQSAFDALQRSLDSQIRAGIEKARRAFLENFDAEVHERLRIHKVATKESLDQRQRMLLDLARYSLGARATFSDVEPTFTLSDKVFSASYHLDWQQAEQCGGVFLRVDHPLAQDIIRRATADRLRTSRVAFRFESHASALRPYVGQAGWLELSKLSATALGRTEECLVVAACDAKGDRIPPDVAARLFSLDGSVVGDEHEPPPPVLDTIRTELKQSRLADISLRNEAYFQEEGEKLDNRANDLRLGIEREIKKQEQELTLLQREARKKRGLHEQLEVRKRVRTLEESLSSKKKTFYEESDRVRKEQDALIATLEGQLKDTLATMELIFSLRWELGDNGI